MVRRYRSLWRFGPKPLFTCRCGCTNLPGRAVRAVPAVVLPPGPMEPSPRRDSPVARPNRRSIRSVVRATPSTRPCARSSGTGGTRTIDAVVIATARRPRLRFPRLSRFLAESPSTPLFRGRLADELSDVRSSSRPLAGDLVKGTRGPAVIAPANAVWSEPEASGRKYPLSRSPVPSGRKALSECCGNSPVRR